MQLQRHHHESEHERTLRWMRRIEAKLDTIISKEDKLAIDQATFDEDLAGLVTAVSAQADATTALTTAVDAFMANNPTVDFSAEDANVQGAVAQAQAATQQLADELAKLNPAEPTPA